MDLLAKIKAWKGFEKAFDLLNTQTKRPGLCCLAFQANGIAIAHTLRDTAQLPLLKHCDFLPAAPEAYAKVLVDYVNTHQLQGTACSLLLHASEYQILHVAPPEVDATEMHNALRWQIKDMITFPATESILDYYAMPGASLATKANNLNVVVANRIYLKKLIGLIKIARLNLQIIDIAELAIKNLLALYPNDEEGTGLLWFRPDAIELTITRKQELYLSRTLVAVKLAEWQAGTDLSKTSKVEELILKVQRSLDYYQSQLRQTPIRSLIATYERSDILQFMAEKLTVGEVLPFDLSKVLKSVRPLPSELNTHCIAVIGGSLR